MLWTRRMGERTDLGNILLIARQNEGLLKVSDNESNETTKYD